MRGALIATLLIALIGAATGFLYWQKIEDARVSSEAKREQAVAGSRKGDDARALCDKARAALIQAIDSHLVPTAAEGVAAAALYRQAAELDPLSIQASSGVTLIDGLNLATQGRLHEAAEKFEAATDGEAQLGGYLHGWLQLTRQQPLEAWGEFGQVLKEHDDWLPARFYRAAADAHLDSDGDHYAELQEAVARWPGQPDVIASMGRALERKHENPDAGVDWLVRAVELGSTDPYVVERVAWRLLETGEAETARDLLVERVALQPYRVDLRLHLARAHEHLEEYDQAEQQLAAVIESVPDDRFLRLTMAIHFLNRGDGPRAGDILETAKELPTEEGMNIGYIGGETLLKNPDLAKRLLATNCQQGFRESCTEACYLGDRVSCASVPGYHDPNRRGGAISVIGNEQQPAYRPAGRNQEGGQVTTADGKPVFESSSSSASSNSSTSSSSTASSGDYFYRGNYNRSLPRSQIGQVRFVPSAGRRRASD